MYLNIQPALVVEYGFIVLTSALAVLFHVIIYQFIYCSNSFRGFTEEDFERVAEYFDRCVKISASIVTQVGPKLKDYKTYLEAGPEKVPELVALGKEVREFSQKFPTIGF